MKNDIYSKAGEVILISDKLDFETEYYQRKRAMFYNNRNFDSSGKENNHNPVYN